jgi:uncharacterized glyoxalase superfamily protein PhnB
MKNGVKPVPDGQHAITPHLVVRGASEAIDFYQRAFGARELMRSPGPDGKSLMHAAVQIGDSRVFLCDEYPEWGVCSPLARGGTSVTINLYCEDVDRAFNQAVAAGAQVKMPPQDMFWGDRYSKITDPFGHEWALATHVEDVAPDELQRRAKAAFCSDGKH